MSRHVSWQASLSGTRGGSLSGSLFEQWSKCRNMMSSCLRRVLLSSHSSIGFYAFGYHQDVLILKVFFFFCNLFLIPMLTSFMKSAAHTGSKPLWQDRHSPSCTYCLFTNLMKINPPRSLNESMNFWLIDSVFYIIGDGKMRSRHRPHTSIADLRASR